MAAIRCSALALLAALILVAGCGDGDGAPVAPVPEQVVAGHCRERVFEGARFTICGYDARRHELALFVDGPDGALRSFEALRGRLGARGERLRFAMNAGMYDEAGMPIGLYVEDGRERHRINTRDGPGNFHLKPNGVFAVAADGSVAIHESGAFARARPPVRWATQSGPMLVIDGRLHPAFQPNGESRHVRIGVGVVDRRRAWFVISEEPVSFGRFARFFRDALGCRDALFFDGTVSSLWDPAARRQDAAYPFGPIAAVFEREAPRAEGRRNQ